MHRTCTAYLVIFPWPVRLVDPMPSSPLTFLRLSPTLLSEVQAFSNPLARETQNMLHNCACLCFLSGLMISLLRKNCFIAHFCDVDRQCSVHTTLMLPCWIVLKHALKVETKLEGEFRAKCFSLSTLSRSVATISAGGQPVLGNTLGLLGHAHPFVFLLHSTGVLPGNLCFRYGSSLQAVCSDDVMSHHCMWPVLVCGLQVQL